MALLSEVYHSINKAKHFPTLAEASSKDEGQTQLGIRNKKHKDIPKIQSNTPKKGRKSNRQFIKELGASLIDSGQSARIDSHFHTPV